MIEQARAYVAAHTSIDEAWRVFKSEVKEVSRSEFRDLVKGVIPDESLERIFFWPDTHFPYADQRAVDLALEAAAKFKPQRIVNLGDWGDFGTVSRHTRSPQRTRDLKVEIDACNKGLDDQDSLGIPIKNWISGNHEFSLERYLTEKAPELFNLVSVRDLLKLDQRGFTFTDYKDYLKIGKIYATHEVGFAGRDAHMRGVAAFGGNIVQGHTHRLAVSYSSTILGDQHVGMMCGWLGDERSADYMYRASRKDWQLGFGIGFMEANGNVHLKPCPIVEYKVEVNGVLIHG